MPVKNLLRGKGREKILICNYEKNMKKKTGFTLIELLVVIAIIGILSSIVLVSLGGAKRKAKDARIQADISQVRAIAELISSATSTGYANLCAAGTLNASAIPPYDAQLTVIKNDISAQNNATTTCYADADNYCVSADLISTGMGRQCVDSTGVSTVTGEANTCDSAAYDCL